MSQAASQAAIFCREVAQTHVVWTVRDDKGFPAPLNPTGQRAQPFWSLRSRVEKIIESISAYNAFTPVEIFWSDFEERWIPGLTKDGLLVGVNWTGQRATGFDLEPAKLRDAIRQQMK